MFYQKELTAFEKTRTDSTILIFIIITLSL